MGIAWLDHVNIRTGGAWHYSGDRAAVHLVEVPKQPAAAEPQVEHFAFRAFGFAPFLDRLRGANISYDIAVVPGLNIRQVNIYDPDGNHIEVQFGPDEQADMAPFAGNGA